jgi:predicted kinase
MKKPIVTLLIGNIGSGKSTIAKELAQNMVVISRDALRYMIGAGKYTFNPKLEHAIWGSEMCIVRQFMKLKTDILVDETGISVTMRKRYIKEAKKFGYKVVAIVLPILSKKESVDRRMQDPHQCPDRTVWEGVWEKFNNQFVMPSKKEGINKIIKL